MSKQMMLMHLIDQKTFFDEKAISSLTKFLNDQPESLVHRKTFNYSRIRQCGRE
jgi:hypothetical protein